MQNPLRPASLNVTSRAWSFHVNVLAASPIVSDELRARIYRLNGLHCEAARIFPRCYFHSNAISLGVDVLLNYGVYIENVAPVAIGPRTALGMFVKVLTSRHEIGDHESRAGTWVVDPVTIGEGCWLGAGSLVLPGVSIGDGCIIAAGSVVTDDCDPDGMYAGSPARRVKDLPIS
jgi:maltose O-acetyltransferase